MKKLDAPIAGANYAADTRNYPWHRPPDITEYDEGCSFAPNARCKPWEILNRFSYLNGRPYRPLCRHTR